jgi:hypothetical protein
MKLAAPRRQLRAHPQLTSNIYISSISVPGALITSSVQKESIFLSVLLLFFPEDPPPTVRKSQLHCASYILHYKDEVHRPAASFF